MRETEYEQLIAELYSAIESRQPFIRKGQSLMIKLRDLRLDIYDEIVNSFSEYDCFYNDDKIPFTINYIKKIYER